MADDQPSGYLGYLVDALQKMPANESIPFGAGTTPQGDPTAVSNTIKALATVPQRAIEGAQSDVANPGSMTVGPAADAAMALAGAGAPMAEPGAAGIFGGKLAQGANLDKLAQAERMLGKDQDMGLIRQITGWHQGPDTQWRFEIPDDRSRLMMPNATEPGYRSAQGPAGALFQHPDLYKAYPELQNIKMTSELDPSYAMGRGSWDPNTANLEISTANPADARLIALHEMQHAVQDIEGFAPGSTRQAFEEIKKNHPDKYALAEQEEGKPLDPSELYHRTAGEAEARNVEYRANMNLQQRYDNAPWRTQDVPYNQQLVAPINDPTILRQLLAGKLRQ